MIRWLKKKITGHEKALGPVSGYGSGGWWPLIYEPFTGAWQRNKELKRESVLTFHAVFSCITIIASDIAKLQLRLMRENNGIWSAVAGDKYPVLKKPNPWQNRIQFFESWMNSKLIRGNTYVLKKRNSKGRVEGLYVLSPDLVTVLVSDDGSVFYQLSQDKMADIKESVVVPASEIIHDRFNCLYHPLVGMSPLYACSMAAYAGTKIQENSSFFFENMSVPSGVLSAPGAISKEVAERIKLTWQENYTGKNAGKVAVLGDDLKYQPMSITPEEAMLVEQLKINGEMVCSAFHVPKHKIYGDAPSNNSIQALNQQYYDQCLQVLIESIEIGLDEGLEISSGYGTEFDLDGLLRMDSTALYDANTKAVGGGWMKPDEARRRVNLQPVTGGNTPYLQQQNYSLEALAKRDAKEDPFAKAGNSPAAPAEDAARMAALLEAINKEFEETHAV